MLTEQVDLRIVGRLLGHLERLLPYVESAKLAGPFAASVAEMDETETRDLLVSACEHFGVPCSTRTGRAEFVGA